MRIFCTCYNFNMKHVSPLWSAFAIALIIASLAAYYKFVLAVPLPPPRTIPVVGVPGSTHTHATMYVMIGDTVINFCSPKFMLKSPLTHFEDNNCIVVHKHATGVTLQTFFKSIGVTLDPKCLMVPDRTPYCVDSEHKLSVVINKKEISVGELNYYELRNNDHILINYGPEMGDDLLFKYNQVPDVPLDVNKSEK